MMIVVTTGGMAIPNIRRPQPTARGSAFEEHWSTKVLEFQSLDFFFHLAEGVQTFPASQGFYLAQGFQTVVLEVQSLESFVFFFLRFRR